MRSSEFRTGRVRCVMLQFVEVFRACGLLLSGGLIFRVSIVAPGQEEVPSSGLREGDRSLCAVLIRHFLMPVFFSCAEQ